MSCFSAGVGNRRGFRYSWVYWLVILACSVPFVSNANLVLFQSSDQHSELPNLENFIRTTSYLRARFQADRQASADQVIYLFNGDLAGASAWTERDQGSFMYYLVSELGQEFPVMLNLGNHEGFDWRNAKGNSTFHRQTAEVIERLRDAQKGDTRLLTANVLPAHDSKNLFGSSRDIATPTGTRIRFVGLILKNLYEVSDYSAAHQPQVFERILDPYEVAKKELEQAAREGIQSIIFFCHDGFHNTVAWVEKLLRWKKTQNGPIQHLRIPVVFAAHDHVPAYTQTKLDNTTFVIDSGTQFAMDMVELDDGAELVSFKHVSVEEQKGYHDFDELTPSERRILQQTAPLYQELKVRNQTVLAQISAFPEIRSDFKKGRTELGTRISNALVQWGRDVLAKEPNPSVLGIVSFYNSSSWRRNVGFEKGPFTRADALSLYPMPGEPSLWLLKGEQIQHLFQTLRTYGEKEQTMYTPQLPSHLREVKERTLEMLNGAGKWEPLQKDGLYVLALDAWLSRNGFLIPEIDTLFKTEKSLSHESYSIHDFLVHYFPAQLTVQGSCLATLR